MTITAKTSYRIGFLDFLQPTITTFDMVMPSGSTGAGYPLQIVELHPVQEILRIYLFLSCDTAHTTDHSHCVAGYTDQIDAFVQACSNSSALAMELLQSCTKPPR